MLEDADNGKLALLVDQGVVSQDGEVEVHSTQGCKVGSVGQGEAKCFTCWTRW
jgi:hypothetical protein